ncbi:MAG: ABC transporter ATP-binding protein [Candidatus Nanoarchaeia archaeon]|jgi:ABC-2 type transport system ATP-binding protein
MLERLKSLFHKPVINYSVSIKGLSVRYGTKTVLDNLSFTIGKRDIFGIIGLSGSGKSTLLKALLGFTHYNGLIKRGKSLGYCPQDEAFFNELSLKENALLFGRMNSLDSGIALSRASKLLKELEVNESLDKMAGQLSGGQQKRLNIILSILHDPDLIVLDEPFAGLDYLNRSLLWDFIKRLRRKGKTIILSTHLLEEAQKHCNNLLIISHGKRFASGSINDLKRSLKFRQYISLRTKYLNKDNELKIKSYCAKKGLKVIELSDKTMSFGLPDTESRKNLLSIIKHLGIKFVITEYRPPALNELFMVSVK